MQACQNRRVFTNDNYYPPPELETITQELTSELNALSKEHTTSESPIEVENENTNVTEPFMITPVVETITGKTDRLASLLIPSPPDTERPSPSIESVQRSIHIIREFARANALPSDIQHIDSSLDLILAIAKERKIKKMKQTMLSFPFTGNKATDDLDPITHEVLMSEPTNSDDDKKVNHSLSVSP